MILLLKSELYKFSLNKIYICTLITVGVICNLLILFNGNSNEFIFMIEVVDVIYIGIGIVIGSIFCLEYKYRTMEVMLITNSNRAKVFTAKYIVALLGILIILSVYTLGFILINIYINNFTIELLVPYIKILMYQHLSFIAIMNFFIFASIILKNYSYLAILLIFLFVIFRMVNTLNANNFISPYFSLITLNIKLYTDCDNNIKVILIYFLISVLLGYFGSLFLFKKDNY